MGKQHRPPERRSEAARDAEASARAPEASGPGNAELQDRLGDVGLDVVREVAFPMVERAALALQLVPREPERLERLVEIVERSRLPDDRRQEILDRLRTDDAVSRGIADAVTRWFGADGETIRGGLGDALDAVWKGLAGGGPAEGGWRVGDRVVALSEPVTDGAVASRAGALVADLAAALAAGGTRDYGEAVRGFCAQVHLALVWDEEEEEEAAAPDVAPVEG